MWFWGSLSPRVQAWGIVDDKRMGVGTHLVRHLPHCVFVSPQYLIVHGCIFIGIPYTVRCCPMPFHVFRAEAKSVRLSIPFCYAPFWVCVSPNVVFQRLHISFNRIHQPAVDGSTNEQLLYKMYRKMCHNIQKRRWKLLLHHTCCHYDIAHEILLSVCSDRFLTNSLTHLTHLDDCHAHFFVKDILYSPRKYLHPTFEFPIQSCVCART